MMTTALKQHSDMPADLDELSRRVVDACFAVHKELGTGLLERIYEEALIAELQSRSIPVESQKAVPVFYKGQKLSSDYKIDLVVDDQIVIELKTVDRIIPVHEAQLISYMKLLPAPLGFIVNFNETLIRDGIKRVVLSNNLRNFASSR